MKYSTHLMAVLCASLMITGCARNISSNNYTSASVGEAMTSYAGSVVKVRAVDIQEGDKLQDNVAGGAIGGLAGGIGGHMLGKGRGNLLATTGGALLGATAGAYAQRALSQQQGLEYTVKLDSGQMMTIVQGTDVALAVGQRVIVQVSSQGRSRVVPA